MSRAEDVGAVGEELVDVRAVRREPVEEPPEPPESLGQPGRQWPGVGLVCTTGQHTGPSLGKGPAYGALPLPLGPTGHSDNDEGVGGR